MVASKFGAFYCDRVNRGRENFVRNDSRFYGAHITIIVNEMDRNR